MVGLSLFWVLVPGAAAHGTSGALCLSAWTGDFETGNLSQWRGSQAKEQSRITLQTKIVRQGRTAARFEVRPGDNNVAGSGSGERAETLIDSSTTDGVEGREQYWAWSTYFPADFDAPMGAWNVFTQFHHTGAKGQVNVHFAVSNRKTVKLRVMGGKLERAIRRDFVLASLKGGRWYDFVFHVRWSSSQTGFVEVWMNGLRVVRKTSTPTLYRGYEVYLKQGYYRSAYRGTTVVYHDGTCRGSTLADVAEFGRHWTPE